MKDFTVITNISQHFQEVLPSVTVLMATYNGEKYLLEQIDSILQQKGVDLNLFVRDDGSSDDTISILNKYQEEGKIKWYTGEHLGVTKGYLDLLRHAPASDYYAFCDQDDIWDDDKLIYAIKKLEELPKDKPLIYYSSQRLVDEQGRLIKVHEIDINRTPYTNFLISNVAGCTTVFNKELFFAINKAEPDFILMHDSWAFKVCLALGGKYYADKIPHINYRQHGNNVAGIGMSFKGKFHQMKRYITVFKIQKQIMSLLSCYRNEMTPEYKKLSEKICNYDTSVRNWFSFLVCRDFNFNNVALNCVVRLKVLLKKL